MSTSLTFVQGSSVISQGTGIIIHWEGSLSGITKLRLGASGNVNIDDSLLKGNRRKAKIYVKNSKSNRDNIFDDVVIEKNKQHILDLDFSRRG